MPRVAKQGAAPTPPRDRVFAFRDFILKTYPLDYLQGAPGGGPDGPGGGDGPSGPCGGWILDVAGGKGDLSWLFANCAPRLKSVIVDPRVTSHKKIESTARWQWEHHRGGTDPEALARIVAEKGPQGRLSTMGGLAPPYRVAAHLRVFLDEPLLAKLAEARAAAADGGGVAASAAAGAWAEAWEAASVRAETLEALGHHQPKGQSITTSMSSRVHRAEDALRLLSSPRLVLGFHPDQATDALVDLALALQVPFAVVPCCVFPSQFPHRTLPGGRLARSYDDHLEFLCSKHPAIRRGTLDFDAGLAAEGNDGVVQPRNTVLYMLPSDYDGQHAGRI
mmetsp:Transcript_66240/g.209391  ORF Transcript_66240/g.209391 Transcript_66240/m.209391 type:complete len:335 (-) Transcript_66240:422-1426(-)